MSRLSISAAWEETRAILARDGRLLSSVALALVALPATATGLVSPNGFAETTAPLWIDLVMLIASLIALAGQLALIRLAIGPSITVGSAIAHGLRRMPVYLLSAIMVVLALIVIGIPFALALAALGVPLEAKPVPVSGILVIVATIYVLIVCFVGVRMVMAAPAASAEPIGSIAILRRSWTLTSGHFWPLLGFLLVFFVGAIIVLAAIVAAAGAVIGLTLGPPEAGSASALLLALVQGLVNAGVTVLFAVMLARIYVQLTGGGVAHPSVPSSGI